MKSFASGLFKLGISLLCFVTLQSQATTPGFSFGGGISRFEYEEPEVMTEKGQLFGLYGAYLRQFENGLSFRAQGEFLAGELDYDGSVQNLNTGVVTPFSTTSDDSVIELQPDLGFTPKLGSILTRFYAGLGYRLWQDRIQGTSGYRRHTTYIYLPLGLEVSVEVSPAIELSFEGQYNLWLSGENKTYLSDVNPIYDDYTFKQNSGRGFQLSSQLTFFMGRLNPFAKLVYQTWDVERSEMKAFDADSVVFEPKNNTSKLMAIFGINL